MTNIIINQPSGLLYCWRFWWRCHGSIWRWWRWRCCWGGWWGKHLACWWTCCPGCDGRSRLYECHFWKQDFDSSFLQQKKIMIIITRLIISMSQFIVFFSSFNFLSALSTLSCKDNNWFNLAFFLKSRDLVVRVELVLRLHLRLQLFVGSLQLGVVPVDRLYLIVGQVVVPRDEGLVVVYFLFL